MSLSPEHVDAMVLRQMQDFSVCGETQNTGDIANRVSYRNKESVSGEVARRSLYRLSNRGLVKRHPIFCGELRWSYVGGEV
ncbi:hypothetical protein [Marinomonas atlantica]|uniref:hypothetical protein n=1 Tax=Marinomonas atlantica TaxID=1806668 RepID=UPI000834CE00|nr:hypothetical protein [Marinomonas atlantica]